MAPKKKPMNAFAMYMSETQQILAKQGIKMSMSEMPDYCKKDWENMSVEKKDEYKAKAKKIKKDGSCEKYTSIGEKVKDIKKQSEDNKSQANTMYLYIEELVRVHPANYYLPRQKFILIHINPYTCEKEGFYFPAEISMVEFSLDRGLTRTFHQLLGFDKVRTKAPPAPTADINNHAKNNHLIDTFSKFPNNYTEVLLKIIGFIIDKDVDEDVLSNNTLDLPPIYTAHCSTGNELMITSSSLYQLYQSAVMYADKDDFNNLLRVYHLDKLFMELKNVSHKIKYPGIDEIALPSVAMATENLAKDMLNTIKSIGCAFHEKLEQAHVCSNYYVCKWIYIISTHCCQYFNIKLVPGCHFDFNLSQTEIPVEQKIENLNISKNDFVNLSLKKQPQDFSANNFPALKGGPSSSVLQKPVWGRPEQKINPPSKTISNKSDNFPPLGSSQKSILENATTTETNSWQKTTGCGRSILNPNHQSENSKRSSKGRGFTNNEN